MRASGWAAGVVAAIAGAALLTSARAAEPAKADKCAPGGGLSFRCGVKHPEDLAVLPGGRWLITSGMDKGSGLHLVDAPAKTWKRWYAAAPKAASTVYRDCAAAPERDNFLAHGVSLRPTGKHRARLYVVNHGGRETIEVFDISTAGAEPSLAWLGCVAMPKDMVANSVAALPDGSILATVLVTPGHTMAESFEGKPTGAVFEWRYGSAGFKRLAGADLPTNNGIDTAPDGKTFYVVSSGNKTVTAFSHTDPVKVLGVAHMPGFTPDNVHWYDGKRLIAAGMADNEPACGGPPKGSAGMAGIMGCARGYGSALIDPATMKATAFVSGQRVPPWSGATMVQKAGGSLWIGSFMADSLAYRPAP
jgi:hypothetical protein